MAKASAIDLALLYDAIEDIEISYDYEETYNKLYNTMYDFWDEEKEYIGEDLFMDYISCDIAKEMAKQELESGGLVRLWYFMGDVNFNTAEMLKVNAYGNLEELDKDDLEYLQDALLGEIDAAFEKAKEAENESN